MALSCKETFSLLYYEHDGLHKEPPPWEPDSYKLIDRIAADEGRFTSNSEVSTSGVNLRVIDKDTVLFASSLPTRTSSLGLPLVICAHVSVDVAVKWTVAVSCLMYRSTTTASLLILAELTHTHTHWAVLHLLSELHHHHQCSVEVKDHCRPDGCNFHVLIRPLLLFGVYLCLQTAKDSLSGRRSSPADHLQSLSLSLSWFVPSNQAVISN